jgi:DNA invertase Pin-like site-specific DNA recombinase
MAAVGYARVSTRDQNPQLQLDALERAGCWPIYQEHASGTASRRPVRDEALAQLQRGDTLTVWKLDRLGRSVVELHAIVADLERRGVRFRVLTQHLDTSTSQGRFFFTMLAAFAEFERELIRERTLAGKARQRAEGRPLGPLPFGWTDPDTINQDQAALLREAARRVTDDGEPLGHITDDWNARDLRPGKATRWRVTHLRRLLVNERTAVIIGTDSHAALVRTFAAPDRQKQGRPAEHLLSGILTCGRPGCGQPLYAAHKTGKTGVPQLVYRCHQAAGSGGRHAGCGRTSVSAVRADAWATEAFLAAVAAPAFTEALNRRRAEVAATDVTAAQMDAWRAELDELAQVLGTRFGTADHRQRHAELERLVAQATTRLLAQPELQALVDLPQTEAKLRAAWEAWTVPERRLWLRRVLEHIAVEPATSQHRGSDVEARFRPVWKV